MSKNTIFVALVTLAALSAAAPAHADKSNGGGSSHSSSHTDHGSSGSTPLAGKDIKSHTGSSASKLGRLNGFFHASPSALEHASPNSAIGKISKIYAGDLQRDLASGQPLTATQLATLKADLQAASNKPLSAATIRQIDDKLARTDPALAGTIATYPGGSAALARDIAAAR